MHEIKLPAYVSLCLENLKANGYSAYVVGGAVRDHLLGRSVNDYDVCTACPPAKISSVFSKYITVETGIKHGTVTVIIDGKSVEITAFRVDGDYSDGRHPDSVRFTNDLYADLSRRDFTVNAIAYNDEEGFIDPFGGINDINSRSIRCVGDPKKRFSEDALRIIRAIRFASVLGFEIDSVTEREIFSQKHRLDLVSKERIRDELNKLIIGKNRFEILNKYREVIAKAIPELVYTFNYDQNNPHHDFDLYTHLIKAADNVQDNYLIALSALLHDIGKPYTVSTDKNGVSHYYSHAEVSSEMSEEILKRLRYSNKEILYVRSLIRFHDGVIEETEKAVKRRINQLGVQGFFDLIALQRADNIAQNVNVDKNRMAHYDKLAKIANEIVASNACVKAEDLCINGHDISALGFTGRDIGIILKHLLLLVIDGEIENERTALIKYIKSNSEKIIKGNGI